MKLTRSFTIGGLGALGIALATRLIVGSASPAALPVSAPDGCTFPAALATWAPHYKRATAVDPLLRQWYRFEAGASLVQIGRHERPDETAAWESSEYSYSTDMRITDVAFRDGGEIYYVAGLRGTGSDCESVIEEWVLRFPDGSVVLRGSPPPPRGTPASMPFISGATVQILGGTFVPPAGRRPVQPTLAKSVIHTSASAGPISAIEADPEGRFLLLRFHETGSLCSLDLGVANPVPVVELDAVAMPALANATGGLTVYEHSTLGRFYELVEGVKHSGVIPSGSLRNFFIDGNNDGVFDSTYSLDGATWKVTPFGDGDQYVSLVNTGVQIP